MPLAARECVLLVAARTVQEALVLRFPLRPRGSRPCDRRAGLRSWGRCPVPARPPRPSARRSPAARSRSSEGQIHDASPGSKNWRNPGCRHPRALPRSTKKDKNRGPASAPATRTATKAAQALLRAPAVRDPTAWSPGACAVPPPCVAPPSRRSGRQAQPAFAAHRRPRRVRRLPSSPFMEFWLRLSRRPISHPAGVIRPCGMHPR